MHYRAAISSAPAETSLLAVGNVCRCSVFEQPGQAGSVDFRVLFQTNNDIHTLGESKTGIYSYVWLWSVPIVFTVDLRATWDPDEIWMKANSEDQSEPLCKLKWFMARKSQMHIAAPARSWLKRLFAFNESVITDILKCHIEVKRCPPGSQAASKMGIIF